MKIGHSVHMGISAIMVLLGLSLVACGGGAAEGDPLAESGTASESSLEGGPEQPALIDRRSGSADASEPARLPMPGGVGIFDVDGHSDAVSRVTAADVARLPAGERLRIDLRVEDQVHVVEDVSRIDLERIILVLPDDRELTLAQWVEEGRAAAGRDVAGLSGGRIVLGRRPLRAAEIGQRLDDGGQRVRAR